MLPIDCHGLEDRLEADAEQAVIVVTATEIGRASPKQMGMFFSSFF